MKKKVTQKIESSFADRIIKNPYPVILIFIIAVYLQVLNFGYTGFDDDFLVINNMHQLSDIDNIVKIFTENSFLTSAVGGFYRPMQTLSFMTDTVIGGGDLWMFHLTNLLLHCLAACLLFIVLTKINIKRNISFSLSLIFSIHPLLSIDVAWLPSRGDLLLTVFCLLAFIQFLNYFNNKKIINLILHAIFLFFAFLSKETGLLFPLILFTYMLIYGKLKTENSNIFDLSSVKILLSWIVTAAVWFGLRSLAVEFLPGNQIFGFAPFLENLATIPEYISKFFLPYKLMPFPVFQTGITAVGIIVIIALIIIFIRNKEANKKQILFGVLWFIILILPGMFYSRNYPYSEHFYHYLDHRMHLPAVGILIFIAGLFANYIPKLKQKNFLIFSFVLIIILSLFSFIHTKNYSSADKFLSSAIESNNESSFAYFLRGNIYKNSGDYNAAINDYTKAIISHPQYAEALNNRGSLYGITGAFNKAIDDLNKAILIDPDIPDGYFNRAIAFDAVGKYEDAVEDFNRTLKYNPADAQVYMLKANSLNSLGKFDESIAAYTKSISLNPEFAESYYNRANAYSSNNRSQDAIEDYSKAISINQDYINAYVNRGIEYYKIQQVSSACQDWQKASGLGSRAAMQMLEKYCK